MKIAVVQTAGVITKQFGDEVTFLKTLLKTVELWCKQNNWTHCVVPQPTTQYNLFAFEPLNGALLKYEAAASVADEFDYIIMMDADMFVWGNPRVPIGSDFWMVRHLFTPQKIQPWDDGKIKPQSYFMCGPALQFKHLFQWIQQQCDSATRDPEVECDYQLERRTSPDRLVSYPRGTRMTDETLLRHWIAKRTVRWIPQNSLVHDFYTPADLRPQQLIHLGGYDKPKTYTFLCEMLKHYKTNRTTFNHLRDVKNKLARANTS